MRAAVLAALLGACGDPAVELTLKLPPSSSIPPTYDLKCVSAIDMVAMPENTTLPDIGQQYFFDRKRPPCVDLERPPENFTDIRNAMRGKFEIPIPLEGLLGVQVRGRSGSCNDDLLYYESIFYGAATYDEDSDSLAVPLVANISCNTKRDYEVRPVDLLEVTATKVCSGPVPGGEVFAGNIRPTLLAPKLDALMFEAGLSAAAPSNGTSIISSYANIATAASCVAMGFQYEDHRGAMCINATAPTLCSEANEIELPSLPMAYMERSTDGGLASKYGPPAFIAAWETTPGKAPIAGATATLPDGALGEVVYLDVTDTRFVPRTGSTGAGGMFAIYADRVVEITIEAPGHMPRKLLVGGTPQLFGSAIAVLTRI